MGSKNKNNKKAAVTEPQPEITEGSGGNVRGKKLIADARFAYSHSDPKFQTHTKQKSKVKIDSRFNKVFTDKNFSTSSISIDKRGKAKRKDTANPLEHFYRIDDEEEDVEKEEANNDESDKSSDDQGDNKKQKLKVNNDSRFNQMVTDKRFSTSSTKKDKRGKAKRKDIQKHAEEDEDKEDFEKEESNDESDKSSDEEDNVRESKLKKLWEQLTDSEDSGSESQSESESELEGDIDDVGSDSDFDSDDEVYSEEEKQEEENIPEIDKETSRLAVVNMDWNQVKAVDLYVLLSSFLPKDGQILSVSVYPSDFGLKRMEEEAVHGPVGLFDDDKNKSEIDEEDDDEELDNEKLRAYELSRLKYYYAVVECDSIATADYLYKTCDGVEFERSSNKLDIRFIPDSMEFKHAPRDVAKEAPTDYEGVDFQTRALQQSKIQLTWDEDEPQRSKTLKRKFNTDQLAELELKEFLASDDSESDEDENENDIGDRSGKRQKKQDMYRALIQSGDGSDGDEEEEGQDMEVTFNTGLEDISKKILEKRDKKSETVWEAYQRKKKEKKKSRKNKSKDSSDDDSDTDREPAEEPNDFFITEEEPTDKEHKKVSGKSSKKGKKAVETAEDEASRAELELLLADNNGESAGLKGYNLKRKKGKGKNGEDVMDEEKIPKVDYEDNRFSSLFNNPLYALDPTDPQFKRSAAHARQIAQKKQMGESNKQNGHKVDDQVEPVKEESTVETGDLKSKKDKYEISSLVKSIKMKSKKVPVPTNVKSSGRKGIN